MRWAIAGGYVCELGSYELLSSGEGKGRNGSKGGEAREGKGGEAKEGRREKGKEARGDLRKGRKARKINKRKEGHIRKGRNAWSDGRESVEQYKKRQRGTTWSSDCYLGELRRCACQRQTKNHYKAISQSVSGCGPGRDARTSECT